MAIQSIARTRIPIRQAPASLLKDVLIQAAHTSGMSKAMGGLPPKNVLEHMDKNTLLKHLRQDYPNANSIEELYSSAKERFTAMAKRINHEGAYTPLEEAKVGALKAVYDKAIAKTKLAKTLGQDTIVAVPNIQHIIGTIKADNPRITTVGRLYGHLVKSFGSIADKAKKALEQGANASNRTRLDIQSC